MAKVQRPRLDVLLVERGLVDSRQKAQGLILSGKVLVNDAPVTKAGTRVKPDVALRIKGAPLPYVSRGGLKLQGALDAFPVLVQGRVCADLGASTGGFTDCLLQRGAAKVHAVDVGYGQLAWSIRQDPRVQVWERTNARHLDTLGEPIELLVGDLSFISLRKILPAVARLAAPGADCVLLVKPQFEVGREGLAKGGVVRDASLRDAAVAAVLDDAVAAGFDARGQIESPIHGAKSGNIEFLVWLTAPLEQPADGR